jgi:type II secretory pathway predicted ATPase ExeA
MALILVGQNELWGRLQPQSYAAIRQRIDLQCKLQPFARAQAGDYVSRHLSYAGTEHDIFSDNALDVIFQYSSGACSMARRTAKELMIIF